MENKPEPPNRLKHLAFIAGGIIVLWLLNWFLLFGLIPNAKEAEVGMAPRGQFGDMFGGLNSLFTGLTFAGLLITILMQRDELTIERVAARKAEKDRGAQLIVLQAQANALSSYAAAAERVGPPIIEWSNPLHTTANGRECYLLNFINTGGFFTIHNLVLTEGKDCGQEGFKDGAIDRMHYGFVRIGKVPDQKFPIKFVLSVENFHGVKSKILVSWHGADKRPGRE